MIQSDGCRSYLCSPHGQCTSWRSWALMCSPAGTDWSDCSQTPDLWIGKCTLIIHIIRPHSLLLNIQTATHIHMWKTVRKELVPVLYIHCISLNTFDVSLVSDSLICGSTCQELLEFHPGFLLVWWVHTHRGLHHWGKTGRIWVHFFMAVTINWFLL